MNMGSGMNMGSSLFMLVGATLFLVAFGLPLLLCPMTWAHRIGWSLPQEKDLANYLGRSLGGVVMAVIIMAFLAATDPWKYRFVFELLVLIGIFMVGVHLYGFMKKNQPLIEHLEIVMYSLLSLFAWHFYPQPPG
jgi:hypothetical protein